MGSSEILNAFRSSWWDNLRSDLTSLRLGIRYIAHIRYLFASDLRHLCLNSFVDLVPGFKCIILWTHCD